MNTNQSFLLLLCDFHLNHVGCGDAAADFNLVNNVVIGCYGLIICADLVYPLHRAMGAWERKRSLLSILDLKIMPFGRSRLLMLVCAIISNVFEIVALFLTTLKTNTNDVLSLPAGELKQLAQLVFLFHFVADVQMMGCFTLYTYWVVSIDSAAFGENWKRQTAMVKAVFTLGTTVMLTLGIGFLVYGFDSLDDYWKWRRWYYIWCCICVAILPMILYFCGKHIHNHTARAKRQNPLLKQKVKRLLRGLRPVQISLLGGLPFCLGVVVVNEVLRSNIGGLLIAKALLYTWFAFFGMIAILPSIWLVFSKRFRKCADRRTVVVDTPLKLVNHKCHNLEIQITETIKACQEEE
ncbi:hypothetical protein HDV03_005553 [Kappamyces sp. JEL0829]|nr:hypothetical protein HDV03_005553 [Kappamyces sp. JEL0829]